MSPQSKSHKGQSSNLKMLGYISAGYICSTNKVLQILYKKVYVVLTNNQCLQWENVACCDMK